MSLPDYGTLDPSTVTDTGLPTITDFSTLDSASPLPTPSPSTDEASPTDSVDVVTVTPTTTVLVDASGNVISYTPLPSNSLATTVPSTNAASVTASMGSSGVPGFSIEGWPQPSSASSGSDSGLSSGSKLAIGLGVSLGVTALVLVGGWLFVQRQRRLRREKTQKRMGEWRRASQESAIRNGVAQGAGFGNMA